MRMDSWDIWHTFRQDIWHTFRQDMWAYTFQIRENLIYRLWRNKQINSKVANIEMVLWQTVSEIEGLDGRRSSDHSVLLSPLRPMLDWGMRFSCTVCTLSISSILNKAWSVLQWAPQPSSSPWSVAMHVSLWLMLIALTGLTVFFFLLAVTSLHVTPTASVVTEPMRCFPTVVSMFTERLLNFTSVLTLYDLNSTDGVRVWIGQWWGLLVDYWFDAWLCLR